MPDVLCNQFLKFPHLHRLVIIIPLQFIAAFLNKEIHHFFGFYALTDDKFVGAFQQVEDQYSKQEGVFCREKISSTAFILPKACVTML